MKHILVVSVIESDGLQINGPDKVNKNFKNWHKIV